MKPILFLWWRQTINGLMRALRSPRRLLGVLALGAFWFLGPLRFLFFPNVGSNQAISRLPELNVVQIESALFIVFSILVLVQIPSLGSRAVLMGPADLDVLFPTPVASRKILGLRMLRDTLTWLLLPLVGALIGIRRIGSVGQIVSENAGPVGTFLAFNLLTLSYLCIAALAVVFSYGVTLFLSQNTTGMMKFKFWYGWITGSAVVGVVMWGGWLVWLNQDDPWRAAAIIRESPLRVITFPAEFATWVVISPLNGQTMLAVVGGLSLLAMVGAGIQFSLSQSGKLYEVAASRAALFGDLMESVRSGDSQKILASQAKSGRLRGGKLKWVMRLRWQGIWSPLWREVILNLRTRIFFQFLIPALIALTPIIVQLLVPAERTRSGRRIEDVISLPFLGISVFLIVTTVISRAQVDFGNVLRRIDLVKPLPFDERKLVISEVLARALAYTLMSLPVFLVSVPVFPKYTDLLAALFLLSTFASVAMVALVLIILLLFPDIEDGGQRAIRSMISTLTTLTGLSIIVAPAVILRVFLNLPYLLCVLPSMFIAAVITFFGVLLAARLYVGFDPKS